MNLFNRFIRLIPSYPLRVATVVAVDGTQITVQEDGGGSYKVIGTAAVGDKVYVRNNTVEGPAPNLPLEVIEE